MREEDKIQAAICDYIAMVAPDVICYAVPNAARRTRGGRAANAVPGLTAGVPDLALVLPGGRAAFVEVKTATGTLTKAQHDFTARLAAAGIPWRTARSIDEVRLALRDWGVPTREAPR